MIRPPRSTALDSNRHAFTALEALVMLVALFILTMLGIGLWRKHNKDAVEGEQAAPPSPAQTIKSESPQPEKDQATETEKPATEPDKPDQ